MNAVVKQQNNELAPVAEGATLLQVIARAAADPNTDVSKMERLMAMYERVEAKRAETAFAEAFSEMQTKLPAVAERGAVSGRYTYALWEDINTAIKPVLAEHGFSLSFRMDFADGIAVTGVLTHKAGHSIETTIKLPPDPSGNKPAVQAVASSVSYGKRYTAGALLNLTSHGEDDDAYTAGCTSQIQDWLSSIEACATVDELVVRGRELAASAVNAKDRKKIKPAYEARLKALRGAK
jgi:hypothetical protein